MAKQPKPPAIKTEHHTYDADWAFTVSNGPIMQLSCACSSNTSGDGSHKTSAAASNAISADNGSGGHAADNTGMADGQQETTAIPSGGPPSQAVSRPCAFCQYEKRLSHLPHWPEMVFAGNRFTIIYRGKILVTFNALEALAVVKTEHDWVQVAASKEWMNARRESLAQLGAQNKPDVKPFDWTFKTDYMGTYGDEMEFEPTKEEIDLEELKKPEKILIYQQVPLFEDELADNGTAELMLKFRAMETGWFLLARYYLRVDHVLLHVRETRLRWSSRLHPDRLLREYRVKQLPSQAWTSAIRDNVLNADLVAMQLPTLSVDLAVLRL